MKNLTVRGAPYAYRCEEGVLQELEAHLTDLGCLDVLIVHGHSSWKAAKAFFPAFKSVTAEYVAYSGECSPAEAERIAELAAGKDAIIGIGGGKVLDLAKAASRIARTETVLIPTVASNCAPWTPISVLYTEDGQFIRFDVHPRNAALLLIDPRLLLTAPADMLAAGIGDTVAKWYEADVQIRKLPSVSVPISIAHFTARQCYEELIHHGKAAVEAAAAGELNDSFVKAAETIIMTGGMVGGFGDHYGRTAAAHSIHNGLTALEETHHVQHGEKVAYGVLIQLVLEDRWDEAEKLIAYYRTIGLPASLAELGLEQVTEEQIRRAAEKAAAPSESIHVLRDGGIDAEEVAHAMLTFEKYTHGRRAIV